MTASAYAIRYRPSEVADGHWQTVTSVRSKGAALDEVASWSYVNLRHGDLVDVEGPRYRALRVFDGATGELRPLPSSIGVGPWEGPGADPAKMLAVASRAGVDRRRLSLAACECAATSLRFVPEGRSAPREALLAVAKWAGGDRRIEPFIPALAWLSDAAPAGDPANARWVLAAAACHRAALSVGVGREELAGLLREAVEFAAGCAVVNSDEYQSTRMPSALYTRRVREASLGMAEVVRRWAPLSVVACARLRMPEPAPLRPGMADL